MRSIILRLVVAILTCAVGVTLPRFGSLRNQNSSSTLGPSSKFQTDDPAVCDLASEISFERIYDGCLGCPDRKIVIRRDSFKKFEDASVVETDLHSKKEWRGRLNPYYFNNLLRLIESQEYFSMNDTYAMGWVDSTIVTVSVRIGDKKKVIRTRSEGDVPIQLWGIYYAIEGALAKVTWEPGH